MTRAARPGPGMPTVRSLRNANRRANRQRINVASVLGAMQNGAALCLHYQHGRRLWQLTSGPFVHDDIATIVTAKPGVVGVGDALFHDMPAQTWRWVG